MENTIEIISSKVTELETELCDLSNVLNDDVKIYNNNFDIVGATFIDIGKKLTKQRRFNKFMLVAAIGGAYVLYKQHKEIKELKSKNEEQENIEK